MRRRLLKRKTRRRAKKQRGGANDGFTEGTVTVAPISGGEEGDPMVLQSKPQMTAAERQDAPA